MTEESKIEVVTSNDVADECTDGVTMGWMPPWLYGTLVYTFTLGGEQRQRLEILELIDIQDGAEVVDIGCGTGSLVLLAANETQASHIVGIDPTESYIERAKSKLLLEAEGDNDNKNHQNCIGSSLHRW